MFDESFVEEREGKILNFSHYYGTKTNIFPHHQIVLIDEGTSNLDNESELAINIALRNSFKTSTVLIIAHRLNGLQNTDRIIVISNGELVETGDFLSLAKDNSTYLSKMLEEQKSNLL